MTVLGDALAMLQALVACDSTNPPRKSERVVAWLVGTLEAMGMRPVVTEHGEGATSVFASRGETTTLLTAHVDTVPIAPGWTRDPFSLAIEGDRAYGLGACDVKGGAAAMLAAARVTDAPCALLFTTDEEAGNATCMRAFVEHHARAFQCAIVAEPTEARAVVAHRGVATGTMRFSGQAGHSSRGGSSANHALVRWASAALERVADTRLNLGRIEGGEKPNVVAAEAEVRFGVRPPHDRDPRDVLTAFAALDSEARFEVRFVGPPLRPRAVAEVARLGLTPGEPVDFWTEAALLSAAGLPSIVLGPGNIAQAHGPDEFVMLAELEAAAQAYRNVLERGAS